VEALKARIEKDVQEVKERVGELEAGRAAASV
jgi:hypothetical protein